MAERVAPAELSPEDRALLTLVQAALPLTPRPFLALGERLGTTEEQVIARLTALRARGLIRKLGPVFEPAALGLATELAAVETEPERADALGAAIAAWPEVTHCYAREHRVNLWYAGVAANTAWFAEAATRIAALEGVRGVWRLPTLRRFKIAVQFDLGPVPDAAPLAPEIEGEAGAVTAELLRLVQADLPLCPEPFAALAATSDLTAERLLGLLRGWVREGVIRRYGALVSHRRLGFTANAMVVMAVPESRIEAAGSIVSASPAVSHCYQRPPFPEFPYSLYAMVHGQSREACLAVTQELMQAAGVTEWKALFSTHEYGKSSPDYAALVAAHEVNRVG